MHHTVGRLIIGTMIIVHGTIPLRPETRDRALTIAREMAEASASEVGCISYDFYLGLLDPNVLMVFQEWTSMEALRDHFQTEHMELFMRELPELLAGEVVTRRFAVQNVEEADDEPSPPEPHPSSTSAVAANRPLRLVRTNPAIGVRAVSPVARPIPPAPHQ